MERAENQVGETVGITRMVSWPVRSKHVQPAGSHANSTPQRVPPPLFESQDVPVPEIHDPPVVCLIVLEADPFSRLMLDVGYRPLINSPDHI